MTRTSCLIPDISGIGIDDMFVIVQCMTNLKSEPDYSKWSLDTKLGMALRHAGVSITVTSATDVVAFAVGAVTVKQNRNRSWLLIEN